MKTIRAARIALLGALAGLFAIPGGGVANPLDLFGSVLGVMAQAQAHAAREAWAGIPDATRVCLERGLTAQRATLSGVIQAGVLPDDPRLSPLAAQCRRFNEAALRRNYACTVPDEQGDPVASTCNKAFARRGNEGRAYPVSLRDAVDRVGRHRGSHLGPDRWRRSARGLGERRGRRVRSHAPSADGRASRALCSLPG